MARFAWIPKCGAAAFIVMAPVLAVTASEVEAQAIWVRPPLERGTSIEVTKVDFRGEQNLSTFSLAYYAGTYLRLRRDLLLVGEVAFATSKIDGFPFSTQAVGNPYIGVEWGQSDAVVWELGVRLPLGDRFNAASALGLSSDAADRLEAWADRAFSLQLTPNLIHRNRDGLVIRLRGGPSLLVPTGRGSDGADLIVAYGGQVGYEGDLVQLLGGVSGRVIATSEGETFNHAVASVAFNLGGLRPAVILRIPFGDVEGVDAIYGVALTFMP